MYFCRVCWRGGMGSWGRDAWWRYICPGLYFSSHSGGSRGNWTLSLTGLCTPWRFEDASVRGEVLDTTEHSTCSSQHNSEIIRHGRCTCNWMIVKQRLLATLNIATVCTLISFLGEHNETQGHMKSFSIESLTTVKKIWDNQCSNLHTEPYYTIVHCILLAATSYSCWMHAQSVIFLDNVLQNSSYKYCHSYVYSRHIE